MSDKQYNTVRENVKNATNDVINMQSKYLITNKARQMFKEYKVKNSEYNKKVYSKKAKLNRYLKILLGMKTTTSF